MGTAIKLTPREVVDIQAAFALVQKVRGEYEAASSVLNDVLLKIYDSRKVTPPGVPVTLKLDGDDVMLAPLGGAVDAGVSGDAEPGVRPVRGKLRGKLTKHLPRRKK